MAIILQRKNVKQSPLCTFYVVPSTSRDFIFFRKSKSYASVRFDIYPSAKKEKTAEILSLYLLAMFSRKKI